MQGMAESYTGTGTESGTESGKKRRVVFTNENGLPS
jgi:hypothetical protein